MGLRLLEMSEPPNPEFPTQISIGKCNSKGNSLLESHIPHLSQGKKFLIFLEDFLLDLGLLGISGLQNPEFSTQISIRNCSSTGNSLLESKIPHLSVENSTQEKIPGFWRGFSPGFGGVAGAGIV